MSHADLKAQAKAGQAKKVAGIRSARDTAKTPQTDPGMRSLGRNGYAAGGPVMDGDTMAKPRLDRSSGKKPAPKGTNVNVIVASAPKEKQPVPVPVPVPAAAAPRPMPAPGGPPGMPPGRPPVAAAPAPMMPRRSSGRVGFATGGAVTAGAESGPGRLQKAAMQKRADTDRDGMKDGGFIKGAIKHPGAERNAAAKAGMTTHTYMEKHKGDSGTAGKRARLGLTLEKLRPGHADGGDVEPRNPSGEGMSDEEKDKYVRSLASSAPKSRGGRT